MGRWRGGGRCRGTWSGGGLDAVMLQKKEQERELMKEEED